MVKDLFFRESRMRTFFLGNEFEKLSARTFFLGIEGFSLPLKLDSVNFTSRGNFFKGGKIGEFFRGGEKV